MSEPKPKFEPQEIPKEELLLPDGTRIQIEKLWHTETIPTGEANQVYAMRLNPGDMYEGEYQGARMTLQYLGINVITRKPVMVPIGKVETEAEFDFEKFEQEAVSKIRMIINSQIAGMILRNPAWSEVREKEERELITSQYLPLLAGFDGIEAWKMRNETLQSSQYKLIGASLAGIDSPAAWKVRETFVSFGKAMGFTALAPVAKSLAGIDTPRAWEIRESIRTAQLPDAQRDELLAYSLIGIDSKEADKIRAEMDKGEHVLLSLTGVDSEYAWDVRDTEAEVLGKNNPYLITSVTGIDSKKADMVRRGEQRGSFPSDALVAQGKSLAGIDSEDAWLFREQNLRFSKFAWEATAASLAGLMSPRAEKIRDELARLGVDALELARSYNGDNTTFVWRNLKKGNK